MAHADRVRRLQLPQNQGLVRIKDREQGYFRAINLAFWAWPGILMSYLTGISFSTNRIQILMTGTLPRGDAIADHLVSIIVPLILMGAKGMKDLKLKSACHPGLHAILLLICSLGLLTNGAHAELHNEADIQSCICTAPHVLENIRDYALMTVAVIILAALTTIGVTVAGTMLNLWSLVPTIPAAVPEIQAIPAAFQALPIIPIVQGDDLDDVLARAPIPRRLNSPLSWL